jgi:acyl-CoA thioester hydrolase
MAHHGVGVGEALGPDRAARRVTYRGSVYPSQCDQMGHMNVAFYVAKFDEATWQLFAAIGLTPSRLRTEAIGMAGVEQHIEYSHELFAGDVVTVTSTILEIKDKAIRFAHEMRNDETGEVAARMQVVAVHLDRAARKARSFPSDVRERARALIEG